MVQLSIDQSEPQVRSSDAFGFRFRRSRQCAGSPRPGPSVAAAGGNSGTPGTGPTQRRSSSKAASTGGTEALGG